MGKVVFFVLGVGITVLVVVKGRELMRKATPAGVQEQVAETAQSWQKRAAEFVSEVTSSMNQREAELREELGLIEDINREGNEMPATAR